MTPHARLALLAFCLAAAACNGDDAMSDDGDAGGRERCLDPLPLDCEPSYPPTFEAFYEQRIVRTCGAASTGGSCHSPAGNGQGGLVLGDADAAYDALLGDGPDGRARVIPGDPECSLLVQRLESDDPDFVMPVGMPLSERERCSVRRWIADGAEP